MTADLGPGTWDRHRPSTLSARRNHRGRSSTCWFDYMFTFSLITTKRSVSVHPIRHCPRERGCCLWIKPPRTVSLRDVGLRLVLLSAHGVRNGPTAPFPASQVHTQSSAPGSSLLPSTQASPPLSQGLRGQVPSRAQLPPRRGVRAHTGPAAGLPRDAHEGGHGAASPCVGSTGCFSEPLASAAHSPRLTPACLHSTARSGTSESQGHRL